MCSNKQFIMFIFDSIYYFLRYTIHELAFYKFLISLLFIISDSLNFLRIEIVNNKLKISLYIDFMSINIYQFHSTFLLSLEWPNITFLILDLFMHDNTYLLFHKLFLMETFLLCL